MGSEHIRHPKAVRAVRVVRGGGVIGLGVSPPCIPGLSGL